MMKDQAVFQRKLSPLNAWAFSFACMIGWAAFVMPATTFLPQAGVLGSLLSFGLGMIAMSAIALNYHFLSNLYAPTSGLYPLVKASINEPIAFSAGWAMGLAHLCCLSLNARAIGRLVRATLENHFQFTFQAYFLGTGIKLIEVVIIAVAIIAFTVINARGIRQTALIQTVGSLVMLAGIVIMLVASIVNADPDVQFTEPLQSPYVSPLYGFLAVFVLTPWAYVGFDSLCSVSQELKFSIKRLGRIMVISLLCGTFAYVANIFITLLGVTKGTGSWPNYLIYLEGKTGLQIYPVLMTTRSAMGRLGTVVFLISCFSAALTGLIGFFASVSRLIYRMAKEGALPEALSKLDPKSGTPVNAVKTMAVVAFILYLFLNAYNSIEELASVAATVGYGICSYAALRDAIQQKKRLYILTGAMGVLSCLFFLFFLLVPIDGISSSISQQGTFFIAVWVFLGIGFYTFSRRKKIEL